mmetsp:Transcript_24533/g.72951  ORF Transcript_24533/g.72951 Transcript_24533/m.72951 type:complete len:225 (+) Transcript_24533:3-677(+)
MRVTLPPPNCQLVPVENLQGALQVAEVEHPYCLVDAAGDNHIFVVFVPIHREDLVLVRLNALHGNVADVQVLDVQHGVTSHRGQAHRPGRRPDRGVRDLLVRREGLYAHALHDVPHLHGVVPGRGGDQLVGVRVPVNVVHLGRVLLQGHDGPLWPRHVEELHRPVALCGGDDVLVGLAPGAVVDTVLGEEVGHRSRGAARGREIEDLEASIAHYAVVLCSTHSE